MTDIESRIRLRAYEKWLEEGKPEGRELDHWTAAAADIGGAGEPRQLAETGDPVQTPEEASHQEKPEISEYRTLMPAKERADSEKAPVTPKIFAPGR